jgi:hypothetical protein
VTRRSRLGGRQGQTCFSRAASITPDVGASVARNSAPGIRSLTLPFVQQVRAPHLVCAPMVRVLAEPQHQLEN